VWLGVLGLAWPAAGETAVIVNEWNAVTDAERLENEGSDDRLGRVAGNGGDWVELVVTRPGTDLRGVRLTWQDESGAGVVVFSDAQAWAELPAGTIVTVSASGRSAGGWDTDATLDEAAGDWWLHCDLSHADGLASIQGDSFRVTHDDWSMAIHGPDGDAWFGPVGEAQATWQGGGINAREAGALLADPSPTTRPDAAYDDVERTTFGLPNVWTNADELETRQDLGVLRTQQMATGDAKSDNPSTPSLRLVRRAVVDIPAPTAEIIGWCPSERLLVSTNPLWQTIDVFRVGSWRNGELQAIDLDDVRPRVEGWRTIGREPTSLAVHPSLPIALVVSPGRRVTDPGHVQAIDLRESSRGGLVINQRVGHHPDSIAISPDGRWAVIACEGEGDPVTPGSVWVMDLQGLTPDRRARDGELPAWELDGLGRIFRKPAGTIEPEFVAFDPQGRFAAVSVQENDAVVFVDFQASDGPKLNGVIYIDPHGEPDGVAVLDNVVGPDGKAGCLVGVCEEGMYEAYEQVWMGNAVSFYWVDPDDLTALPRQMSRLDARLLIDPDDPDRRRDPEGIALFRKGDRAYAAVTIERGDRLLLLDVTDATKPELVTRLRIGDRPEGVLVIDDPAQGRFIVTGDEGNEGPGTISIVEVIDE